MTKYSICPDCGEEMVGDTCIECENTKADFDLSTYVPERTRKPLPVGSGGRAAVKPPIGELEVGESIFWPAVQNTQATIATDVGSVRKKQYPERQFRCRKVTEEIDGVSFDGVRIWRIE